MPEMKSMSAESSQKIYAFAERMRVHPDANVRTTLANILGVYDYTDQSEVSPLSWNNPDFYPTFHEFQQLGLECGIKETGVVRDILRHLLGMGELPLRYAPEPSASVPSVSGEIPVPSHQNPGAVPESFEPTIMAVKSPDKSRDADKSSGIISKGQTPEDQAGLIKPQAIVDIK